MTLRPALVLLLVLLTSCTSTTRPEGPKPVDNDAIVYDLTTPPSREELGFKPGDRGMERGRPGRGTLLDVTVLLPGGRQLTAQAFRVDSTASANIDMAPDNLDIYTLAEDDAAANEALTAAAPILGLSAESVRRGREVLARQPNALGTGTILELDGSQIGYLSPGLGIRRNEPNKDVTVTYSFVWGDPLAPVSAPPAVP